MEHYYRACLELFKSLTGSLFWGRGFQENPCGTEIPVHSFAIVSLSCFNLLQVYYYKQI